MRNSNNSLILRFKEGYPFKNSFSRAPQTIGHSNNSFIRVTEKIASRINHANNKGVIENTLPSPGNFGRIFKRNYNIRTIRSSNDEISRFSNYQGSSTSNIIEYPQMYGTGTFKASMSLK